MASLNIWLTAARPKTLVVITAPVFIGTALAFKEGAFHFYTFLTTYCTGLLIQILTNLANDYFDFKKGADTEERIGPSRIMQKGLASEKAMKKAMALCCFGIFLGGFYLIFLGGWPIAALIALSIFLAV